MNARTLALCGTLVLFAFLPGCAAKTPRGNIAHLDEKDGFRGARFLTPFAAFDDLEFAEIREGMECFERRGENLRLGDADVSSIKYCFYKGRLASVILWGAGRDTGAAVLSELRRAYGQGEPINVKQQGASEPVGEMWKGDRVTAVYLFVWRKTYPQIDNSEVVVTLSSNELLEERAAEKRAAERGSR